MADMIPIEYLFVAALPLIIAVCYLVTVVQSYRSFNPEGKIFIEGRRKGLPVLSVENIANGHGWFLLGKKDQDNDPIFDLDGTGLKVDPSMCSGDAEPTRYGNGLNIWHFATSKALPISMVSALAYKTMREHRYDTAVGKHLSFLTTQELFSLMRTPRENLTHDARIFLEKYSPARMKISDTESDSQLDLVEFVTELTIMQDFFAGLPVETGFFCYHKAFKDIPYAHSSQDIERIKYLFEQKAWEQWEGRVKLMQYVIMALMMMIGGAFAIYVLSMVAGKK